MHHRLLIALAVSALVPAAAFAQQKKTAPAAAPKKSGGVAYADNGYGLAGCGLGSIAFGPAPGPIQIVAATLNATGYQTFAITTGTSNCDIPEMGQRAAVFIEVNREVLAKDAARGQGETVAGLASILNCDNPTTFGRHLQSNYEAIFSQSSSYDATRAILSTIDSNPALAASCHQG